MNIHKISLCLIIVVAFGLSAVAATNENINQQVVNVKSAELKEGMNEVKTVAGYHVNAVVKSGKVTGVVVTDPNGNPVKTEQPTAVVKTKCWHCVEIIVDGQTRSRDCWEVPCDTIRNPGGPKTN